ncbi:unnamed protein product, partial [Ectocarpus sp. 12 AP-2014]
MASSERLDELVARARALFESKHGPSEGCFAAYSPAIINVMGDAIEGSGGLTLQMTLDRRVVIFGRGRVIPAPDSPTGGKRGGPTSPRQQQVFGMAVVEEDGREGEDEAGGGVHGGRRSASKPPSKLSVSERRKNAGKAVDTIVQDLVFGRKNRSKSVFSPAKGTGVTATWLKDKNARVAMSKGGVGAGEGHGGSAGRYQSVPSPSYADSSGHGSGHSSGHGSRHWSASAPATVPSWTDAGGSHSSRTAARAGDGINADPDSNATTPRSGADSLTPLGAAVPPRLSSSPREEYRGGGSGGGGGFTPQYGSSAATTAAGSTTTEESFPVEPGGRSNSGSSIENGSRSGRGGGGGGSGGGGDHRVRGGGGGGDGDDVGRGSGSIDSLATDTAASSLHGYDGGGGDWDASKEEEGGGEGEPGLDGVLAAAAAALAAAKEVAGGARVSTTPANTQHHVSESLPPPPPPLSLGSSSTDAGGGFERGGPAMGSPRLGAGGY